MNDKRLGVSLRVEMNRPGRGWRGRDRLCWLGPTAAALTTWPIRIGVMLPLTGIRHRRPEAPRRLPFWANR
jgi:hypothetical protein